MHPVPKDDVDRLLRECGTHCISLYMQTYRGARETNQNGIRFRNLIRRADDALEELGASADERRELLQPLHDLVDDHEFWQNQDCGLAVFRSRDVFNLYRTPTTFEELAVVEDRFHLKPLLGLFNANERFFVLELGINNAALYEADRFGMREMDLGDAPTRLEDAVGSELGEQSLQFHTNRASAWKGKGGGAFRGVGPANRGVQAGPAGAGPAGPIYHGHGEGDDDRKGEIRQWFTILRDAIEDGVVDRQTPIVLAGVEYLFPFFRDVTNLNVLPDGVHGNAEPLRPEELHRKAWPIVERYLTRELDGVAEELPSLESKGKGSSELEDVLVASLDGRVRTLFVSRDDHVWGRFDVARRAIRRYDEQRPGADDLLDLAAVNTLAKGGKVWVVDPDKLPTGRQLAAVYRY